MERKTIMKDGKISAKVMAETFAATITPMLGLWLADAFRYIQVNAGESILLGIVVGAISGATGYIKAPRPDEQVITKVVPDKGDDSTYYP